jgi:hypothetical protein
MPRQSLDPELATVVERGRRLAEELGELRPRRIGTYRSAFTDEARAIVADWQRDGGYERALDEIATGDPDLAVE